MKREITKTKRFSPFNNSAILKRLFINRVYPSALVGQSVDTRGSIHGNSWINPWTLVHG